MIWDEASPAATGTDSANALSSFVSWSSVPDANKKAVVATSVLIESSMFIIVFIFYNVNKITLA
jgi:hypothetical protein